MASKIWLLVEWVDETNMFPSYGVVNYDNLAYKEKELQPGNVVYVRAKHENPRRGKIIRISESKQYAKEHREFLERQDQQMKNVLQLCMRTIKEMKSDTPPIHYNPKLASNHIASPHIMVSRNTNSGSDSESEPNSRVERNNIQSVKSTPQFLQYNRKDPKIQQVRASLNTTQQRRRSMVSSTPLPTSSAPQNVTLCFDQATQTDTSYLKPSLEKIEQMETVLKNLYKRFQYIVSQVNIKSNASMSMSESELNEDLLFIEANNESIINRNNTEDQGSMEITEHDQDVRTEQVIESNGGDQPQNLSSNAKVEDRMNPNAPRVRRMSAQTTNNIEISSNDVDLVSIGNGNTKVPMRLLHDIDWNSHTSATRQLLQAVFPRSVLATHSLTGKQSPAFMNRPPKKILDPKIVEDIVKIVSTRCGVPKNLVRNSITIKCTDEAKLYRNRQQYKQRKIIENDENRPPSTASSDESSHTIIN